MRRLEGEGREPVDAAPQWQSSAPGDTTIFSRRKGCKRRDSTEARGHVFPANRNNLNLRRSRLSSAVCEFVDARWTPKRLTGA
jgi:hypothetical protein